MVIHNIWFLLAYTVPPHHVTLILCGVVSNLGLSVLFFSYYYYVVIEAVIKCD